MSDWLIVVGFVTAVLFIWPGLVVAARNRAHRRFSRFPTKWPDPDAKWIWPERRRP